MTTSPALKYQGFPRSLSGRPLGCPPAGICFSTAEDTFAQPTLAQSRLYVVILSAAEDPQRALLTKERSDAGLPNAAWQTASATTASFVVIP